MRILELNLCTNLEQSNKLLEVGLDPRTADLFYEGHDEDKLKIGTPDLNLDCPAWSLKRLIELATSLSQEKFRNAEFNQDQEYLNINFYSEFDDIQQRELNQKLVASAVTLVTWSLDKKYLK